MKAIQLSDGMVAFGDDEDYERLVKTQPVPITIWRDRTTGDLTSRNIIPEDAA